MASLASPSLLWQVIRNNHAGLMKARNIRKPFSKEASNLKNVNAFRYNGYVQKRTLGVEAHPHNKGAVLVLKKRGTARKPSASRVCIPLTKGKVHAVHTVLNVTRKKGPRRDLRGLACRRAVAIIRSQQTPKPRRSKK